MRGIFSLVGLLLCVAILATVWANHTATVSKSGNHAREQAQDLSGHDANGKPAIDSITLDAGLVAGQMKSLVVKDIESGGAMEKKYHLKKDDKIIQIGGLPVAGGGDFETLKAILLQEGFEKSQPLIVIRDGQEMTLEATGGIGIP